jgi:hypothetical protein
LGEVFEESDLRAGLKDGGQVLGAFIVARSEEEFVIYMRPSWGRGRGFRIIRTWRGANGDRAFKNLQSAWCFIRKFDFVGRVTVYPVGDAELRQFVGVIAQDLEASPRLAGSDRNITADMVAGPTEPPTHVAADDLLAPAHLARPDGNKPVGRSSLAAKTRGRSP